MTDRNGDGLLWAALQSGNAETVELVVKAGATGENHNLYWAEPAALTIAERQDWQQLLSTLEEQHTDTGCTAPSIAYCCTAMGNAERLSLYLAHFPLSAEEAALPEGDSTTVALRYGVESAQTGNLLDLAVANDDTETAAVLLQNGVTASPLLLKKLQASPTTLSDEMLALLGSYRYFGVLDEVLADYRAFKESYEAVAGKAAAASSGITQPTVRPWKRAIASPPPALWIAACWMRSWVSCRQCRMWQSPRPRPSTPCGT